MARSMLRRRSSREAGRSASGWRCSREAPGHDRDHSCAGGEVSAVATEEAGPATARALPISVEAARSLLGAGDGLVVVLLRHGQVVGTAHWPTGDGGTAQEVAASVRADQAVVIVVGSPRVAGALILRADAMTKELSASGVEVTANIHLFDHGRRWADLALINPRDGFLARIVRRHR